jgi:hypothetical protein
VIQPEHLDLPFNFLFVYILIPASLKLEGFFFLKSLEPDHLSLFRSCPYYFYQTLIVKQLIWVYFPFYRYS